MKLSPRRQKHLKYLAHAAGMTTVWLIPFVGPVVVVSGIFIGDPSVWSPMTGVYHAAALLIPDSEEDKRQKEAGEKCKPGMPYWDM